MRRHQHNPDGISSAHAESTDYHRSLEHGTAAGGGGARGTVPIHVFPGSADSGAAVSDPPYGRDGCRSGRGGCAFSRSLVARFPGQRYPTDQRVGGGSALVNDGRFPRIDRAFRRPAAVLHGADVGAGPSKGPDVARVSRSVQSSAPVALLSCLAEEPVLGQLRACGDREPQLSG